MAVHVAGDSYYGLDGQLFEIKRQLRQPSGYPYDPEQLQHHLQAAIEGRFCGEPSGSFARDMRKEGWKLLQHTPRRLTSVIDLELVLFLKQGENSVGGEEMVRRARFELDANYGQEDAEWLLKHQEEIPAEFRKFYITFVATVWQDSYGIRHVPCLYWYGKRWILYFHWLVSEGFSNDRLLRPRK